MRILGDVYKPHLLIQAQVDVMWAITGCRYQVTMLVNRLHVSQLIFRHTLEYCTMIFNKPKGWSNYARNNDKVKIKEMRMSV